MDSINSRTVILYMIGKIADDTFIACKFNTIAFDCSAFCQYANLNFIIIDISITDFQAA